MPTTTRQNITDLPSAPTCGHQLHTLVDTDHSTWAPTEVYACDTCGARHATPWEA